MAKPPNMEVQTHANTSTFQPPRGIEPALLLKQVRNTAPFIFEPDFLTSSSVGTAYIATLRKAAHDFEVDPSTELTHDQYFELCLSAHHATVGSFVPTDVDNQIRF